MGKRMNLGPQPPLFSSEMMCFSSHMLVTQVWYTVNLSRAGFHNLLNIYSSCILISGQVECSISLLFICYFSDIGSFSFWKTRSYNQLTSTLWK